MGKTLADRFWAKVNKTDGCWLWTASLGTHGYGQIGVGRSVVAASRVAWMLTFGPIPDGLFVCHRCDVPKCVNPEHLFLATQAGNLRDMAMKGRGRNRPAFGSANPRAKLAERDAIDIRRRYAEGESLRVLGRHFGVWPTTIADVVHKRTWNK
jgi:hypothetical protein